MLSLSNDCKSSNVNGMLLMKLSQVKMIALVEGDEAAFLVEDIKIVRGQEWCSYFLSIPQIVMLIIWYKQNC